MVASRIWFTAAQKAELWERWKNGQSAAAMVVVRMTLSLAPPVEYAADPPASIERFLLIRVQAVIKRLKLGLDCLQAGKPGIGHLFGERHSARRRSKIWLVSA